MKFVYEPDEDLLVIQLFGPDELNDRHNHSVTEPHGLTVNYDKNSVPLSIVVKKASKKYPNTDFYPYLVDYTIYSLRCTDVTRITDISSLGIEKMCKDGKLKYKVIDGVIRISADSVHKWMKTRASHVPN